MSISRSYPALTPYALRRKPPRTNVLVISPHPDDDVIGCGATLNRLASRGARISVVYVTDGSASHVKSVRFPPQTLRDVREAEARDALRELGVGTPPRFLRAPDGKLAELGSGEQLRLATEIARLIDRRRTHVLLTPLARDPHPDHIATAALVATARRLCVRRPATYAYGVWLAIRGTAADAPCGAQESLCEIVLTPAEVARKRAAIMAHRSQTGMLVDDDPAGFRIDENMLARWLEPVERLYRSGDPQNG